MRRKKCYAKLLPELYNAKKITTGNEGDCREEKKYKFEK